MIKEELSASVTVIKDPKMEPFFIGKDSYCYTVYQKVNPDPRYARKTTDLEKEYIKVLGHYSNFGSCLKVVAQNKANNKKSYESVKEYLEYYNRVRDEIKSLTNLV